jgi:hypothetical protein
LFEGEPEAGNATKKEFEEAGRKLLYQNKIHIQTVGFGTTRQRLYYRIGPKPE